MYKNYNHQRPSPYHGIFNDDYSGAYSIWIQKDFAQSRTLVLLESKEVIFWAGAISASFFAKVTN